MRSVMLKKYYDDPKWAYSHFHKWRKKYGNKWLAVLNRKIIASGDDVGVVIDKLSKKSIQSKNATIVFVEKVRHVLIHYGY